MEAGICTSTFPLLITIDAPALCKAWICSFVNVNVALILLSTLITTTALSAIFARAESLILYLLPCFITFGLISFILFELPGFSPGLLPGFSPGLVLVLLLALS